MVTAILTVQLQVIGIVFLVDNTTHEQINQVKK